MAAFSAVATVPLAHGSSSDATRFGTDALAAALNGALAVVATKAARTSIAGLRAKRTRNQPAAPASSEPTITRRRSSRSLMRPDTGPIRPATPAEATSEADTHAAEPVCSKTV